MLRSMLTTWLYYSNHLLQKQMITQAINLLGQISSGNFTRELDKEPLLNQSPIYTKSSWSVLLIINPALISMLLSYVYLKVAILYTCALMSFSRSFYYLLGLMTSYHVTCHVTTVSHASSSSKRKEKEKKIPIKSENKIK